ncbi:epimerase [Pedobacter sp. L105]|uniref:epimerase n=1 Tax=Pedobacter sp. L105 TaxID=1641871 RepID=UPI00131AB919
MEIKVVITGATGMVGEGVLFECLEHPDVKEVLLIGRKPYGMIHPKLKECIVPDFFKLDGLDDQLTGYDACFYCAGISSLGMDEPTYTYITYDTTLHFANKLLSLNPKMIFDFISGGQTDSSEKGKVMWARVKGKTENALMRMPFERVYNFRPGFMKPKPGQKNIKGYYRVISFLYPLLNLLFPKHGNTIGDLGLALINSVLKGYDKQILETKDIKLLAKA